MPTWPAGLPKPQVQGFQAEDVPSIVTFQPDYGEPMLRRGSTADVRKLELAFDIDADDLATLLNFYRADCAGGSLSFSMTDPEDGDDANFVFSGSPVRTAYGGSWFGVTINLIRLP